MEDLDWEQLLHVLTLQGVSGPPVAPGLLSSLQHLQLEGPVQPEHPAGSKAVVRPTSHKRKAGGPPNTPGRSQTQRQQLKDSPRKNVGTAADQEQPLHTALILPEMLDLVFKSLDCQSLCAAGSVCRHWRTASQDEKYWTRLEFSSSRGFGSPGDSAMIVPLLAKRCAVQHLVLRDMDISSLASSRIPSTFSRLHTLDLSTHFGDLQPLVSSCPSLLHLNVSQALLRKVVLDSGKLQAVALEECIITELKLRTPCLTRLNLRASFVGGFASDITLSRVTYLDIAGCKFDSMQAIHGIARIFPNLESVDVSEVASFTPAVLTSWSQHLERLNRLVAQRCSAQNLHLPACPFPRLAHLDLKGCCALDCSHLCGMLDGYINLETLCLDECLLPEALTLQLPKLQLLSIVGISGVRTVTVNCPALEELRLQACLADPVAHITHISVSSRAMSSISWGSIVDLEQLTLMCPILLEVHLLRCLALKDTAVANFNSPSPLGAGMHRSWQLRLLSLDGCEELQQVRLHSTTLQHLSLDGCKRLQELDLDCPGLSHLGLDEAEQLRKVHLRQMPAEKLCLGACGAMESLTLTAATLQHLDLKGCGSLMKADLHCPGLETLDLSFARSLPESALRALLAQMPRLTSLALPICESLGAQVLSRAWLPHLTYLDLFSTPIQDLTAIGMACPKLQTLNISRCHHLKPDALEPLLWPQPVQSSSSHMDALPTALLCQELFDDVEGEAGEEVDGREASGGDSSGAVLMLPELRELDVSYSHLPTASICQLLGQASRLTSLSVSGCSGAQDEIWEVLDAAPSSALFRGSADGSEVMNAGFSKCDQHRGAMPEAERHADAALEACHQLQTLSCVSCKELTICRVGMREAPAGDPAAAGSSSSPAWVPCPTKAAGLQTLKLGLSKIARLALALPNLTLLDAHSCSDLVHLDLHCPLLLHTLFHSCRSLDDAHLHSALFPGAPAMIGLGDEDMLD
ncbi:hypothetical protein WJX74_006462 [Apatococcus lobatus]|uniref:F-box domain-containing protein n=1 Tax=Apatococcus lobatus TaxID=904363 RepID=A0AAW1RSU3_9CHLO